MSEAIRPLADRIPQARWTSPDSWHVTLRFLGEVGEDRVAEVASIVREASLGCPSLISWLTDLGCFPNPRRARVIWIGIHDPGAELGRLASKLDSGLGSAGFRREARALHPHITVARIRAPGPIADQMEEIGPLEIDRDPFPILESILFRSHLSPKGSRYEALERFSFGLEAPRQ